MIKERCRRRGMRRRRIMKAGENEKEILKEEIVESSRIRIRIRIRRKGGG